MSMSLKNKVAVVTGGNSGIGLSTAQTLVNDGAKVIVVGRNQERLERAVSALGPNAKAVQGDVSNTQDLERMFNTIRSTHGKIDVLFVNAGVAEFIPMDQVDVDHFDRLFDTNVKGAYFTVQKALPHLNDGASIILNTSVSGGKGIPGSTVYSATKAAVRSFARTLASELAPRGIRVNAVSPGLTETPILEKMGLDSDVIEAFSADMSSKTPAGRLAQPQEIANVAAFLASSASSFVNGAEFAVDGGYSQV